MVRLVAAIWLWALAALPAGAEGCRLALVLALDVSSSVDEVEYDLQRIGLAAALNAPEVRHAVLRGGTGAVALSVYEWSGRYKQTVLLDWVLLQAEADIDRAVDALAGATRSESEFPTAMGYGIGYAAQMLSRAPTCERRVIDVSGDGVNNEGFGPRIAYRHFPLADVTVNGLVILGHDDEVLGFYRNEVIRGRNAFVETANGFGDFRNAMTRKLYREINDIMLGGAIPRSPRG
ncbi:DUF1194 domain-containing protein [Roseovarius sp. A21]|uniref:DUF1194 domain-containing protein n=1 Tax=Roseovarius bejariae TaxID=2576383 RepID=A0A844CSJ2_9RHOB|nr:DUF1194 domain-containing protein [Roseovarius bejariae]MRU16425.1 DUF1194 domain-containing protein [Roseovarius bejariae]